MAGRKGRGGRPRLSATAHVLNGTYRPDRHGPLPDDVQPLRAMPLASLVPASSLGVTLRMLDADDCPDVLTQEGRAFWLKLVVTRPTEKIFGQLLATYVQAWCDWQRATVAIQQTGALVKQGRRPVPNPHFKLRADAQRTMFEAATFLGWRASAAKADQVPVAAPSKLSLFLASRSQI